MSRLAFTLLILLPAVLAVPTRHSHSLGFPLRIFSSSAQFSRSSSLSLPSAFSTRQSSVTGLTLDTCIDSTDCSGDRTCVSTASVVCTPADSSCTCRPDALRYCATSADCDGEICANTSIDLVSFCVSEAAVSSGLNVEVAKPPVAGGTLTMDPCSIEDQCLGGRQCMSVVDDIEPCEGRKSCLCLPKVPPLCFHNADCSNGEVCAEAPFPRQPICLSPDAAKRLPSIDVVVVPSAPKGFSFDHCESDDDCQGTRQCGSFGNEEGLLPCEDGDVCACAPADGNAQSCGSGFPSCDDGEVCAETGYVTGSICVSKDVEQGFFWVQSVEQGEATPAPVPPVGGSESDSAEIDAEEPATDDESDIDVTEPSPTVPEPSPVAGSEDNSEEPSPTGLPEPSAVSQGADDTGKPSVSDEGDESSGTNNPDKPSGNGTPVDGSDSSEVSPEEEETPGSETDGEGSASRPTKKPATGGINSPPGPETGTPEASAGPVAPPSAGPGLDSGEGVLGAAEPSPGAGEELDGVDALPTPDLDGTPDGLETSPEESGAALADDGTEPAADVPNVAEPAATEGDDEVCVDARALGHLEGAELVYARHVVARVLCDAGGSCATGAHVVVWKGRAMMMSRYCKEVGCSAAIMRVNSPKYRRKRRVGSRTEGLEYTAFAARYGTRAEETVLAAAVRLGL